MTNPQQLSLEFDQVPLIRSSTLESTCESATESIATPCPAILGVERPDVERSDVECSVVEQSSVEQLCPEKECIQINPNGFLLRPPIDSSGLQLPIPFELKVSPKARQVYLRVEPGRGLQITIPKRYPKRTIPELVESQRAWITEALEDLDNKTPALYRQWPPSQLHLQADQCLVNISYKARRADGPREASRNGVAKGRITKGRITQGQTPKRRVSKRGLSEKDQALPASAKWLSPTELELDVDTENKPLVALVISKALKARAKEILDPWLSACSHASQLKYKRLVIRGQRTVWGSYSSSGTLSLNYKLLFLEADLVDYVLRHELAHIKHLDHSAAFWRFLESLKPNALQLDRDLKEAGSQVPPWLELVASA